MKILRPLLLMVLVVAGILVARAQDATRVIDQDPYDLLTLKATGQQFKLVPLEMAKRQVPVPYSADATLLVRLQKRPEQQYQIAWSDVARIELFEEIVLEEAKKLVDQRAYDQAFEYYAFLRQYSPEFPGLTAAQQSCLFREADDRRQGGDYRHMFALLRELYEQEPQYPGLSQAMGMAVDRLVEAYFAEGENAAARVLLAELERNYPQHDVVQKRRQELIDRARQTLQQAEVQRKEGAMRAACQLAEESVAIWPELPGARELARQLHREYPMVEVGVRQLPAADVRSFTIDWAAGRHQRLTRRRLFEVEGFSETGPEYRSPLAEWQLEDGLLTINIRSDATWADSGQPLTSHDVAQGILAAWNGDGLEVPRVWRPSLAGVEPTDSRSLVIRWAFLPPQWPSLLRLSPISQRDAAAGVGPYQLAERGATTARFVSVPDQQGAVRPREIVERRFGSVASAIGALREADIHVLDRLPPWELPSVRRYPELRIGRYAAPTVHMLVVNPRSERLGQVLARRGLTHALNRHEVFTQLVGSDAAAAGAVLSGPFPGGFANDEDVVPRPWDPRLAIALWQPLRAADQEDVEPLALTMVYPPSDIARRASRAMQQQLQLGELGIQLQLRQLTSAEVPDTATWDLRYVEWPAMQPIVDATRLLGPDGVAQLDSFSVRSALDRLAHAATMPDAEEALHEIHRAVHDSCWIIPLWQLDEFFVYHQSLAGVEDRPVTLYQSVEQWDWELE